MPIPGLPTPQDQLDYYCLVRNIVWRYKLDEAEEAVIKRLSSLLAEMRGEVSQRILRYRPEQYTRARLEELLQEIEVYSDAVKAAAIKIVADESGAALGASLAEHADILSVGGRASRVAAVNTGSADFGALMLSAPIGGRFLQDWVDSAFSGGQEAIRNAIQTGMFQGEGYRRIVKRVMAEAMEMTERETITLVRTYVQSANVAAQEAVFQRNSDVIGWLEWRAVMEPSYKQTGRGTCLRCVAMDSRRFRVDDENRPTPGGEWHPRCRCMYVPIVDWAGIGIPQLAVEEAVRPYTIRENLNIDAGGRREILEVGMHKGDWASWAAGRNEAFQVNALGPQRYTLWQESGLPLDEFVRGLVNLRTGRLYTVPQLESRL